MRTATRPYNGGGVPALVADVGARAAKRFANFFGSIANDNTRAAYQRACQNFFAWCDANGLDELAAIEPIHVGPYARIISPTASAGGCASTKKAARSTRCRRITISKPIWTPTCMRPVSSRRKE